MCESACVCVCLCNANAFVAGRNVAHSMYRIPTPQRQVHRTTPYHITSHTNTDTNMATGIHYGHTLQLRVGK